MTLYTPTLRNFSILKNTFPGLPCREGWVFTKFNREKDVVWNIIACYAKQSPILLLEHLERLGCEKQVRKHLVNDLKRWNPFRGRTSFKIDTNASHEKGVFFIKSKIKSYYNENPDMFHSDHGQYISIQALSNLLDCKILLVINQREESGKDTKYVKVFPDTIGALPLLRKKCIFIFDDVVGNIETFSFCLTKEIGLKHRNSVLKGILKTQNENFNKICLSPNIEENIVLYLLSCCEVSQRYLELPVVFEELRGASFEVDSVNILNRMLDNSISFEALCVSDIFLFYFLYNSMEESYLPLDELIVKKLEPLKRTLTSISSTCFTEKVNEMQNYNEFHMEMYTILHELKEKRANNNFNCSINVMYEVKYTKHMIISIWEIWEKYCKTENKSLNTAAYFENINFRVMLLIFDGLLLLKETDIISTELLINVIKIASKLINLIMSTNLACINIEQMTKYKENLKNCENFPRKGEITDTKGVQSISTKRKVLENEEIQKCYFFSIGKFSKCKNRSLYSIQKMKIGEESNTYSGNPFDTTPNPKGLNPEELKDFTLENEQGKVNYEKSETTEKLHSENIFDSRGNTLEFLRDQIKVIKKILNDANLDLKELWEADEEHETRQRLQHKITQLYISDPQIKASVEMFAYHCWDILQTKEWTILVRRVSNVFNSVNVRNCIPEYNFFVMLNPNNPVSIYITSSDLIEKLLQLVDDGRIIDNILKIVKQSETDLYGFLDIMKDDNDEDYRYLRDEILDCDRWKQYALLIPMA